MRLKTEKMHLLKCFMANDEYMYGESVCLWKSPWKNSNPLFNPFINGPAWFLLKDA